MTLPAASMLSLVGIGFILAFGAWKLTITPRLAKRAHATLS